MHPSAFEAFPDASVDPAPGRRAVFNWASPEQGLKLLEVEGELEDAAVTRWSGVLGAGIKDGATGIVVDLRGCPAVGPICLSAMLAAASTLRARGGGGVTLVTYPDSTLDRKLRAGGTTELPAHSSATRALVSLRDAK
jgi:anti-anti-sigma regulatory factor